MRDGFKWYFVVPEGFSEGFFRGVRRALEMPFFASPGYGMKNAKKSDAFYLSGASRAFDHNINHARVARELHAGTK